MNKCSDVTKDEGEDAGDDVIRRADPGNLRACHLKPPLNTGRVHVVNPVNNETYNRQIQFQAAVFSTL